MWPYMKYQTQLEHLLENMYMRMKNVQKRAGMIMIKFPLTVIFIITLKPRRKVQQDLTVI